jgi:phage shock protein PspC (stress-responsive transcriptional regulator)
MGGFGLLLYLAAIFIVPLNPHPPAEKSPLAQKSPNVAIGLAMIVTGILLIFGLHRWRCFPWIFPCFWRMIWPVGLIILGAILLLYHKKPPSSEQSQDYSPKRLYRLREGRLFLGIAGGTGDYFHLDRSLARLACVLFFLLSGGLGIIAYFILYFILPEKPIVFTGGENDSQK